VAHTCNPGYSEGRDQGDRGLKPAQANSLQDPISKNPITKKGLEVYVPAQKKKKKKKDRDCY
jgi:hypothetical protein